MNSQEAHQHFSVACFNGTWGLLDMAERTPEQVREMLYQAQASLYHWTQRDDCEPENLSIGLWQVSRVYAVLDSAVEAMRYAKDCLEISQETELSAFHVGYAHEAVARAAMVAGDSVLANVHIDKAIECAALIDDTGSQQMVLDDVKSIRERLES